MKATEHELTVAVEAIARKGCEIAGIDFDDLTPMGRYPHRSLALPLAAAALEAIPDRGRLCSRCACEQEARR